MPKQASTKDMVLSVRVTGELYELLAETAQQDQRSISNLVSVILTNWQRDKEKSGGGDQEVT